MLLFTFQRPQRIRNWTMGLNKQMGGGGEVDLSSSNLSRAPLLLHGSLKNAKRKAPVLHPTLRMSFPNFANLEMSVENACHTLESFPRITEFSHLTLKLSLF